MGRPCTICQHENRGDIEDAIARQVGIRQIAVRYRLSYSSIGRHKASHMIIIEDDESGIKVVHRLQDVIDLPVEMRERSELITALLDRALEPLYQSGKGSGLAYTQTEFIINLLRLQQNDERTILKATGILHEDGKHAPISPSSDGPDIPMSKRFAFLAKALEHTALKLNNGDREMAAQVRREFEDMLTATDEIDGTKMTEAGGNINNGINDEQDE